MKARRFTAATMQKALKIVREQMGPDAVILSNHRVKGGVEIIVAENYEPRSANTVAPVYNEDHEDGLPSPTFSGSARAAQQSPKTDKNPWPFLSAEEQKDVADQLKLQDQLEALKQQRDAENKKQNTPASQAAKANASRRVEKSRADEDEPYRGNAKQSRFPGLGFTDTPQPLPTSFDDLQSPVANINSKEALRDALNSIKESRESGAPMPRPLFGLEGGGAEPANSASQREDSFEARARKQTEEQLRKSEEEKAYSRQLIDDVRGELQSLKDLLKSGQGNQTDQLAARFVWKKYSPNNSLQVKLWQRLEQMGFSDWLIHQLVHDVKSDEDDAKTWQSVLRDVTHHLPVAPSDKLKRGGIYALVGPTGAGKTTTLAKMAVRYVIEHEGHQVGLITLDNYRLAAHDQLKTLGQILGVPVQVADDEHPLRQCIENLSECDLILIDTAGLTPEHPMLKYQLDQIKQLGPTVNTLLTLPATSHSRVLRKVYHNYKAAGLTGCVLTKLDEASCLGDAISVLLENDLALSYYTDGQRIPDDFHVADAKALVKRSVQIAQAEQQLAKETYGMAQHG